jgi:hypothetical protein
MPLSTIFQLYILTNLTKILSMCLIYIPQKLVGLSLIGWLIPDVTKYQLLIDVRTELKWDARTVTNIPGNTAHCFVAFFWLTEGSRNKN